MPSVVSMRELLCSVTAAASAGVTERATRCRPMGLNVGRQRHLGRNERRSALSNDVRPCVAPGPVRSGDSRAGRCRAAIQSIERAAAVLRLLAAGPRPLGACRGGRGSLGLAKGTVARDPAHAGRRRLRRAGPGHRQVPARRARCCTSGTSYLDVNELRSRAINWADALAVAQRRGGPDRLAARRPGRSSCTTCSARTTRSQTGRDRAACCRPRQRDRQGAARVRHRRGRPRSPARASEAYTRRTIVRRRADLTQELAEIRERGWASEVEEMSIGAGRRRRADPRPRRPGGRRPSGSPARSSGCATGAGAPRTDAGHPGPRTPRARCPRARGRAGGEP